MSTADRPEDSPLQAGSAAPDLTMNYWKKGESAEPDAQAAGNGQEAAQQSVFSSRSGIQDPLIRSESKPEASAAEADVEPQESGDEPDEAEQEAVPAPPGRKRHKQKGRPKAVKSKRQLERVRRRQMNYLQRRREQKKLRVFYNRIRLVFKLCFALLWGVLLWELMHSSLWTYHPADFTVKNTQLLKAEQLEPLIQQWDGKPLYMVDTGKLARQIESRFDMVDRAVVRRHMFPSRLDVQVVEKAPWAEFYTDEKHLRPYALGVPDGIISLEQYYYRPEVYAGRNLERILINPRTTFKLSYLERLREIAWQARQLKGLHLDNVDVRNPNQVILNFREIPVILGRLDNNAADRLVRIVALLPKIAEFREGIEAVDLRWEKQVTFHQKPNAKLDLPKPEQTQG
ncbi:MAG: hypothetical protein K0Q50_1751 [Vampirovibrio sp.]|jgi:cell division septal protein FtsQ|nr:hypothetical protein [Vampirovibrio sp.]